VAKVRTAAAVHDVGKLQVPREVINKPGKLTDEEFAAIKRHPQDGAEMVSGMGDPEITAIVRHHHERLDGRGYPDGLSAADIPLGARIVAVADTFDALTSSRPYRAASKHKKAIDILKKEAGSQLDPDAVAAFLSYYSGRRPVAWWTAITTAPPRLFQWLMGSLQGASAAPLAKSLSGAGAAALIGSSLVAPAMTAKADPEESASGRSGQAIAHVPRPATTHSAAGGEAKRGDDVRRGIP
jgi:HD domain